MKMVIRYKKQIKTGAREESETEITVQELERAIGRQPMGKHRKRISQIK